MRDEHCDEGRLLAHLDRALDPLPLEPLHLVHERGARLARGARRLEEHPDPLVGVGGVLEHAAPLLGRLARQLGLYALLLLQHLHPHLLRLARHALLLLERLLEDRVALGELRLHLLARLVGHGAAAHAAGCAASTARGSGRRQLRLQLLDLRLELPTSVICSPCAP